MEPLCRDSKILVSALFVSVVCAAACGSGATSAVGGDDTIAGDIPNGVPDGAAPPDTGPAVVPDSAGPGPEVKDRDGFQRADLPLVEGGTGWPCSNNDQCDSGYCIPTADGEVCTQTCIEWCPEGWACRATPSLVDSNYICVPRFVTLCDPCARNADCTGGYAGVDDRCLDYGEDGKFCGGDCAASGRCPPGYECRTVEGDVRQCMPVEGSCTCSPRALQLELATVCYREDDEGRCDGTRWCAPTGLSDCDAEIPAAEVCDGADNDCDGLVDEQDGGTVCEIANQYGVCIGTSLCVSGVPLCEGDPPEPEACNGEDDDCDGTIDEGYPDSDGDTYHDCIDSDDDNDDIPDEVDICPRDYDPIPEGASGQPNYDGDELGDACDDDDDDDGVADVNDCAPFDANILPGATEECDGIDNNCDGATDEGLCEDGNDCTDDICTPEGSCLHPANTAACEDGNLCTQNDRCLDKLCNPGALLNCDDGNDCTSDACDPNTGTCRNVIASGAPCQDTNFCTDNDYCGPSGLCLPGPWKTCDDGNPCTSDRCEAAAGCVYDGAALDGRPCDDGNDCLLGDICGGGFCTPGPIDHCVEENDCTSGVFIGTCLMSPFPPPFDVPVCAGICLAAEPSQP